MNSFDRLHSAIQHHVVNSLEWSSLRPLQEASIEPLLNGEHALLLAPTAAGKTEAAFLPLLSRMLAEDWSGLSILYICPIKALLNSLEIRLREYSTLVGRRVELWHGDIPEPVRKRIRSEPPDILLTTPESLEVMLVSRKSTPTRFFANVRAVVVDELHAFAGDDRGWHLLSVMERINKMAGGAIQRVGLSATIGNPDELLIWLTGSSSSPRRVINPSTTAPANPELGLDYVASIDNAATVISRLHHGEKRLVFCDSRARVEQLAVALRNLEVNTFVSHSSLSADERHRAEEAFREGTDCVIVATSTLELGIDVGDLDRVIQIDAPYSVASFLQRLGRTGRRKGTTRNCLFLATSDDGLVRAAALLRLFAGGYVEPIVPPELPYHVFAQQLMALILQEGGIGRTSWRDWLGNLPVFSSMETDHTDAVIAHMLATEILFEADGLLSFGTAGERQYGFRNFMEVLSVFTSPPLFRVLCGRDEIGLVDQLTFQVKRGASTILALGGRNWMVRNIDWRNRIAHVEPTTKQGKSRWMGSSQPLNFRLCRSIREVLTGGTPPGNISKRAATKLAEIQTEHTWLMSAGPTLVHDQAEAKSRLFTHAGLRANLMLSRRLGVIDSAGLAPCDNFSITLPGQPSMAELAETLRVRSASEAPVVPIATDALDTLKFADCLPRPLLQALVSRRMEDEDGFNACVSEFQGALLTHFSSR